MASIHRETLLTASADEVWARLREVGNVHRLFPGVPVDARLEDDIRDVAFANGPDARDEAHLSRLQTALVRMGHHRGVQQGSGLDGVLLGEVGPDQERPVRRDVVMIAQAV